MSSEMQTINCSPDDHTFVYLHPRADIASQNSAMDLANSICPAAAYQLQVLRDRLRKQMQTEWACSMLRGKGRVCCEPLKFDVFNFPWQLLEPTLPELLGHIDALDREKGKARELSPEAVRTFGNSELVEGLVSYYRLGVLPLWLPVALQAYCEMYEIIGSESARMAHDYLDR